MALSDATKGLVTESAFGHFGDKGVSATWDIAQKISDKLGITDGGDRIRVHNVVQQAKRSWIEAEEMRSGDRQEAFSTSFRDPTLQGSPDEFRYRVVIEVNDPATGQRYSTLVIVDSAAPMTADAVEEMAKRKHRGQAGDDDRYPDRHGLSQQAELTPTIVGVGRK